MAICRTVFQILVICCLLSFNAQYLDFCNWEIDRNRIGEKLLHCMESGLEEKLLLKQWGCQQDRLSHSKDWALFTWQRRQNLKENASMFLEILQPFTTSTQRWCVIHLRTSADGHVKCLRRWAWMHRDRRGNASRHNPSNTEQGPGRFCCESPIGFYVADA